MKLGYKISHMKIGLFYSYPRFEEKSFLAAAQTLKLKIQKIRTTDLAIELKAKKTNNFQCDLILLRSLSHYQNYYCANFCHTYKIPTLNPLAVLHTCGDKFLTSLALTRNRIPTLKTWICFSVESALATAKKIGYPIVIKPNIGSWGRLIAKISDQASLEALLEHKQFLGGSTHASIFYLQEYIAKKAQRDIRILTCGQEILGAIYRQSEHWITNTARGGTTLKLKITPSIKNLVQKTIKALAFSELSLLGIDLIETPQGLKVLEVNAGVEFHGLSETTQEDLAFKILQKIQAQKG